MYVPVKPCNTLTSRTSTLKTVAVCSTETWHPRKILHAATTYN